MTTPAITAAGRLRLDGRYLLIKQIGSGGMSVVWHALDEVLGRYVAVKVLSADLAADPQFPRRLLSEARAVAALSHPHVTAVHDFGVHRSDGLWTPYLVMELLDGQLLSEALRYGPLPWRQAVSLCAELASAVQTAHDHGIVHGDVTPANVMLTPTGVKVLDFGIAALVGDAQTGSGDVYGTATHLAPERLTTGQITAAADVYAAGLVLYQCLAGRLPWTAETITETLYAHAHLPPHPLAILGLPHAIEQICLQSLAREPHHRPTSAQMAQVLATEMLRLDAATIRLGEHAARMNARGGPITTLPVAAPRRRHAAPRRVLAGVTALLCALAVGYTLRAAGPQTAAAQPQDTATAAPCSVIYTVEPVTASQFAARLTVTNTTPEPVRQWTLLFSQPAQQPISAATASAQQAVVISVTSHSSGQAQTVSLAGKSTLEAGASITRTLHGQYSGPPAVPGSFTLNGKRCDVTVILSAAPAPQAAATAAGALSAWDKPTGKFKKPHGKQPKSRGT